MIGDTLALAYERIGVEPLLKPVMRGGRLPEPPPSLHDDRARAKSRLAAMMASLHSPGAAQAQAQAPAVSKNLCDLARRVDEYLALLAQTDRVHWET